jgi:hypothetical protein
MGHNTSEFKVADAEVTRGVAIGDQPILDVSGTGDATTGVEHLLQ